MRTKLKGLIREEAGAALVLTLVLLLIGGLIIAPLLGHMGTGHTAGQVHEKRMDELYAADAGVEMAIWQITNDPSAPVEPMILNDKYVEVDINMVACREYAITSEATTPGVSSTVITSIVFMRTLWDNALATRNDIELKGDTIIVGDIWYEGAFDPPDDLEHDGAITEPGQDDWPSDAEIQAFAEMLKQQALATGDIRDGMTITDNIALGPTYFTGDLIIKKEVTIDLNGTIYVEGSIKAEKEFEINGSGAIVAEEDIDMYKWSAGEGDNNTIMSIEGDIKFWKEADMAALIFAPRGTVDFKMHCNVYGAIVASNTISSDKGFRVVYDDGIGDREELWLMGQGRWILQTWVVDLQTLA